MLKILAHQVKIAVDFYIYGKSQTAALNLNIQIVLNSNGYTVNIFIIKMYTVIYRLLLPDTAGGPEPVVN